MSMSTLIQKRLRQRIAVVLASLFVATGLTLPTTVHAVTSAPVVVAADAVELRWEQIPDATAYLVVDDYENRVLWRGEQTTTRIPATAPSALSLLVVALTETGETVVAKVMATLPDPASARTPMTAMTTAEGTWFSWGALSGVTSYTVEGDGIPAMSVASTAVNLPAKLGETAEYNMYAKPPVVGEITDATVTDVHYGVRVTPASTDVSSASQQTREGDVLPAGIPTILASRFNYETYIPWQWIDAPEDGYYLNCESGDNGEDWWYNGNNRGKYDYGVGNYKSLTSAYYAWTRAKTYPSKGITTTKRYKKVGTSYIYDSSRTASTEDIVITPLDNTGRTAYTSVEHEAGHPYCTPFARISYEQTQVAYSSGGYGMSGTHDRMPNHQQYRTIYYSDGTQSNYLMFDHPLTDPKCLNEIYSSWKCGGKWEYQVQG
ncbi:hypothetical protein [Streptomyces himalayensis]|uniref:Secreted protein n=1 Tax=Streptomyces himalayensis subsp. himalayensis TaxID=2756131 RepID=A0A7W0DH05_9ACTN|nr:hypothetical protein [Streptomyces himalayensis]MBA2944858.1 hypothetical protein [Streptomyces himalayensis subsp. himalayensis]